MSVLLTSLSSRHDLNPDRDFILHGRGSSYWERKEYYPNSSLTGTTAQLSQHSIYNPDNYRVKKKVYARSMTDLANNLQVLSHEVDNTLKKGVPYDYGEIDKEIAKEMQYQRQLKKEITAADFREPFPGETLRTELDEDELLRMYEERVKQLELTGKPKSPRESQWFVNPNHIVGNTSEAPTLQSVGRSYRYGKTNENVMSDKDKKAMDFFPATFSSAYEMCALDYPACETLNASAPPSMRMSRSKSASKLNKSYTFRTPDRSFRDDQDLDKLFLLTNEAPTIGKSGVYLTSPHQLTLGKLRLERLRLEEAKLLELKRQDELERIRGPRPKWYMSKGPDFHYEAKKNTQLVRSLSEYQDMLDYREDLLRSSGDNPHILNSCTW
ncbi:hypothetical protein MAR_017474 [Mya arenaria]|uniref:Uncharacterized protein n=1 Tax=Mya arenaria TaxID=6604 RepID=A0ABY7EFE0_MYAAR|nr:hypothetical protein MAR_017474 [Mya arenaria]